MRVSTNQFRNGMVLILEGTMYNLVYFQHVKPGKGGAFVRTRLKNFQTGAVLEKTFKSGDSFESIEVRDREMQYLYADNDLYYFMDQETYEQSAVSAAMVEDILPFLKENDIVTAARTEEQILSVSLPQHIVREITETEPGLKGDTSTNSTKPATIETGAVIQVPLFINKGDWIKINTIEKSYVSRGEAS